MKRALAPLFKLNDTLARVEGFLLSIFLLGMVCLAFLQVVMRNIFNAGLPWADTIVRHMVLWVGFLGATLATKLNQHLTLEVLTKYLPERGCHLAAVLVKIFAGVISFFLLCAALRFIAQEKSTGAQFLHLFPSWWAVSIIPLTFMLIPFHLFFSIVNDIESLVKGKKA